MPLIYDASVPYDTADYTYDGVLYSSFLGIKEAIYRELKFGVLAGLVDPERIHLDARIVPEHSYPYVIFRRITASEENNVRYARERFEIEIVSTDVDELETIREAILEAFAGRTKTWGQYEADGTPVRAGLRMRCSYVSTVDLSKTSLQEKSMILIFLFSYPNG